MWVSMAALMFAALYQRSFEIVDIILPTIGESTLWGVDPYYFLRHVEFTFENYPILMKADHATHFPNGTLADAGGLFTLAMSSFCKLFMSTWNEDEAIRILAWFPVLLGVISMLLVFVVAKSVESKFCGIVAGVLFFFFPGLSLARTSLGFLDHHALEIVLVLAILISLLSLIKRSNNDRFRPLFSAWLAIPLSLSWVLWPGAPLYYLASGVTMLSIVLLDSYERTPKSYISKHLMVFFVTAGLIPFLISIICPSWITLPGTLESMRLLHIACLTSVITGFALAALIALINNEKPLLNLSPLVIRIILGVMSLAAILGILFYSNYGGTVIAFIANEAFLVESVTFSLDKFYELFGVTTITFTLSIAVLLGLGIVGKLSKDKWLLLIYSLFFVGYWIFTGDLGYLVAPFLCLISALLIISLDFQLPLKYQSRIFGSSLFKYSLPLIALFILASYGFKPHMVIMTQQSVQAGIAYDQSWKQACDWLRENTEPLDLGVMELVENGRKGVSRSSSDYGVMTGWDYGNLINQRAKRVPVWSRWPSGLDSRWLTCTTESESMQLLCPDCSDGQKVSYAIVDSKMAGSHFNAKLLESGVVLNDCIDRKIIYPHEQATNVVTLGACLTNSLAYELFFRNAENLSNYELVWASDQKVILGYTLTGSSVMLDDFKVTEQDVARLRAENNRYVDIGRSIIFDYILTNQVKIFKVIYD